MFTVIVSPAARRGIINKDRVFKQFLLRRFFIDRYGIREIESLPEEPPHVTIRERKTGSYAADVTNTSVSMAGVLFSLLVSRFGDDDPLILRSRQTRVKGSSIAFVFVIVFAAARLHPQLNMIKLEIKCLLYGTLPQSAVPQRNLIDLSRKSSFSYDN